MEENKGKILELEELTETKQRKEKCLIGIMTILMISRFTEKDILDLGEEEFKEVNQIFDREMNSEYVRNLTSNLSGDVLEMEDEIDMVRNMLIEVFS